MPELRLELGHYAPHTMSRRLRVPQSSRERFPALLSAPKASLQSDAEADGGAQELLLAAARHYVVRRTHPTSPACPAPPIGAQGRRATLGFASARSGWWSPSAAAHPQSPPNSAPRGAGMSARIVQMRGSDGSA